MNKYVAIAAILSLLILGSMIVTAFASPPPIQRLDQLYEVTIQGGNPETIDYSWCYDTASAEVIQNVMDTLIQFNGEHTDQYVGRIATNWTGPSGGLGGYYTAIPLNGGLGIDSGLPIAGLNFENPSAQAGPNATYYYRYDFKIRQSVFGAGYSDTSKAPQTNKNYSITPADIAYSFQRTIIQDRVSGPQWMLQEPLLDQAAGDNIDATGGVANFSIPLQVQELGNLIKHSVEYNDTDVWFNVMYPSPYAPFMQILSQQWSSIESQQWINDVVIGALGRPDWDGKWTDLSYWTNFWNPTKSPLDNPSPVMYGSGPYVLITLDQANNFWEASRNTHYWDSPISFPTVAGAGPAGTVDDIKVTWAFDWPTASSMFTLGQCDYVGVPQRSYISQLYTNSTPPFQPPNYPLSGIRCYNPLPTLTADAFFFTFFINPASPYGPFNAPGVFTETAIPTDFFGNPNWGIYIRKGFAYAMDYLNLTATALLGEGAGPMSSPPVATAIIPGLSYYDPTVTGYSYNLALANASFNMVPGLANTGFTITSIWNEGNLLRKTSTLILKANIESLNPRYHINSVGTGWSTALSLAPYHDLPMFMIGWLADFPDPHDFALPFYASWGSFPLWQDYGNATMDALVNQGIATPDGPARQAVYTAIQKLAVADVPDFLIAQPTGRHFERDWVDGWYYNSIYPGVNFYNQWKWYYPPASGLNADVANATSYNVPADVNLDGKVDIKDVKAVVNAFGATFGPPIGARWVYRCDVNLDRKIDIKDVTYIARLFGRTTAPWPLLKSTLTASLNPVVHGTPDTFTETTSMATPWTYTVNNVEWLIAQDGVATTLVSVGGGTSLTFSYTFSAPGTYNVYNIITYTATWPATGITKTTTIDEWIAVVVT